MSTIEQMKARQMKARLVEIETSRTAQLGTVYECIDLLERLASAHPGSYPTNVIEVIHQCGEITGGYGVLSPEINGDR